VFASDTLCGLTIDARTVCELLMSEMGVRRSFSSSPGAWALTAAAAADADATVLSGTELVNFISRQCANTIDVRTSGAQPLNRRR
jgi:hypothetical protein